MVQLIERLTNSRIDYEPLSKKDTEGIEKGLGDIKKGKVHTLEQIKKRYGIKQ